jgi:hypothetical protein
MDYNAMVTASFLPLLYWTGTVIAVTLFGYPGVACMTPLAWLLALPVGFRLARESRRAQPMLLYESLAAGGALGLWQGVLLVAAMTLGQYVTNAGAELAVAWPALLAALIISMPVTAGLAALAAWWGRLRQVK